jgi:hypothetical protein
MDVWMALEIASLESYKPRSISFGCTILMNWCFFPELEHENIVLMLW